MARRGFLFSSETLPITDNHRLRSILSLLLWLLLGSSLGALFGGIIALLVAKYTPVCSFPELWLGSFLNCAFGYLYAGLAIGASAGITAGFKASRYHRQKQFGPHGRKRGIN